MKDYVLMLYWQVHPAPTTGSRSASTGSTSSGFSSETSPSLTSPQPGILTFVYSHQLVVTTAGLSPEPDTPGCPSKPPLPPKRLQLQQPPPAGKLQQLQGFSHNKFQVSKRNSLFSKLY